MYRLKFNFFNIHTIRTSVYLFICILLFSCAQVVAPGGGPKDITAPKVVKYIPDSAQLNFKAKSISITFDEFVQLKDLNNQLVISPPLEQAPDISIKNKSLIIDLDKKEVLKPNTTYSLSFGNALQDITENNPNENLKYIFSTGSFIDSLSLKGKIENAFDHRTEKGIYVMLYSDLKDSVIYKKQPDYFAKTKDDGSFQINNIRNGKYKLLALKDANANYKYDNELETIGFYDTIIDVSKEQHILIDMFQEPAKKFFLKKHFYNSYGNIVFIFNKPSDSILVTPINYTFKEGDVLLDYSKNGDTLNYWFENFEKDSLIVQVKNGYKILDTVAFQVIKKEAAVKNKRTPLKLHLVNNFNGNQGVDLNADLKLIFSHPIASINEQALVTLKRDSIAITNLSFSKATSAPEKSIKINFNESSLPSKKSADTKKAPLKESAAYHLFIPPGTFTDIFGLTNDTIKVDFKTRAEKFYGTVKLKLTIPETTYNYIVQLLDDKENVIRENNIQKSEVINYEYLQPQKYKLKIIYDSNKNNKWDGGNYLQKLQPEKVIYNLEPINIRSNWDMDLEWNITK
jgi:uncharacterized protein (DUF2141 family)